MSELVLRLGCVDEPCHHSNFPFLGGTFRLFLMVSFRFAAHINHWIEPTSSGVISHDLLHLFWGYHNHHLGFFRAFQDEFSFVAAQGSFAPHEPEVAISDRQVCNRRFTYPWISGDRSISNNSNLEMAHGAGQFAVAFVQLEN